jgi:hypothetical protein
MAIPRIRLDPNATYPPASSPTATPPTPAGVTPAGPPGPPTGSVPSPTPAAVKAGEPTISEPATVNVAVTVAAPVVPTPPAPVVAPAPVPGPPTGGIPSPASSAPVATPPPLPVSVPGAATPPAAPIPTPAPVAPSVSPVAAFGQPMPVVVMGPNPLPVVGMKGSGGGGGGSGSAAAKAGRLGKMKKAAKSFVGGAGAAAAGIAKNNPMPAFSGAVDLASSGLEKLGPAGKVAAAGVEVFGEAVKAGKVTVNSFVERAEELSIYSGRLASAVAKAEAQQTIADIREAGKSEESLSELVETSSALLAAVKEILTPIKVVVCDIMTQVMRAILWGVEKMVQLLNAMTFALVGGIRDALAEIRRIRDELGGGGAEIIDHWLKAGEPHGPVGGAIGGLLRGVIPPDPAGPPAAVAAPGGLGVPLVGAP